MKTFVTNVLLGGALLMGASGLMAQSDNSWREQYFRAKFGRNTPLEETRQNAEAVSTAFREEFTTPMPANTWYEEYFKAKFGRVSPLEEARQNTQAASTAFREEEPTEVVAPVNNWHAQMFRMKTG